MNDGIVNEKLELLDCVTQRGRWERGEVENMRKKMIDNDSIVFEKCMGLLLQGDSQGLSENLDDLKDIDHLDKDGRSLLFHSVLNEDISMMNILINKSSCVNIKDKLGWTPLHYAVSSFFLEGIKSLIKAGADVNAKDDFGNTVLWRAVFTSKGRREVIDLLLKYDALPEIKNDSGVSALDLAKTISNYEIEVFFER